MEGIEPTTPRLQITCSGQLSYIGSVSEKECKYTAFFETGNTFAVYLCKIFYFVFGLTVSSVHLMTEMPLFSN